MKGLIVKISTAVLFIFANNIAIAGTGLSQRGMLDDIAYRFDSVASTWGTVLQNHASWLFWTLVLISMVWTFGMMAIRRADTQEFFAEFFRFTFFTGFYYWLLSNAVTGWRIGPTIIESLQRIAAQAGGLPNTRMGPSSIVDIGFSLLDKVSFVVSQYSWKQFHNSFALTLLAIIILVILALVAINMLLTLISAWILMYAGVFFLGFGGARWTSEIAINYFKSVLSIGAQIFSMLLIVAIGKSFLIDSANQLSVQFDFAELAVMLVISITLLYLVNKIPPIIAGIVNGNFNALSSPGFGAGNAMGAGMAAIGATTAALSAGAQGAAAAGGAATSAIASGAGLAAAANAAAMASEGMSILSDEAGDDSGENTVASGLDTPFAQASGMADNFKDSSSYSGADGGDNSPSDSDEKAEASNFDSSSKDDFDFQHQSDSPDDGTNADMDNGEAISDLDDLQEAESNNENNSQSATSIFASMAKQKAANKLKNNRVTSAIKDKIDNSTGGRLASAIKEDYAEAIEAVQAKRGEDFADR